MPTTATSSTATKIGIERLENSSAPNMTNMGTARTPGSWIPCPSYMLKTMATRMSTVAIRLAAVCLPLLFSRMAGTHSIAAPNSTTPSGVPPTRRLSRPSVRVAASAIQSTTASVRWRCPLSDLSNAGADFLTLEAGGMRPSESHSKPIAPGRAGC